MKRVKLLIVMWIFAYPLFAQNAVQVMGTVTNTANGTPVPNHQVIIQTDSMNGIPFYHVVTTNPNGFYSDYIPVGPLGSTGVIHISTYDCQQYQIAYTQTYGPGITTLVQNFAICYFPVNCEASFTFQQTGPLTFHFQDISVGGNSLRLWDFGDGTSSSNIDPLHTFPAQGLYSVKLTIGAPGTTCWDSIIQMIQVGDSIPPACQANFTFVPIGPLAFHFYDNSTGGNEQRLWDFGDGTTSSNFDPVHTFPYQGYFSVSLSIGSPNASCYDMTVQTIQVGDSIQTGCQAYFYAQQQNQPPNMVSFINQSSGYPNLFTWDFGDGTATTIASPGNPNIDHQYASPGTYLVCLSIQGNDSLCSDTWCNQIVVQGSSSTCEADFTYESVPGTPPNMISFTDLSTANGAISWFWDFGDGTTSTEQNPVHMYPPNPSFGPYYTCLTITDSLGMCNDVYCEYVDFEIQQDCHAEFTFGEIFGADFNTFQFTDISTAPGPVSWFWNFDDGTTSTEQNPIHTFPQGPVIDPYYVCLTITSLDSSCIDTYCAWVLPENQGCVAAFDFYSASDSSLTMHFEDHSLGNIWLWTWVFGDGDTLNVTYPNSPNVSHTYETPGFYEVCLLIRGNFDFCSSSFCKTIAVNGPVPGCQAQFTYYPDSSNSGNYIQFIDLSVGETVSWFWSFGDGTSSNLQSPGHTFAAPGTYYVCLTINGQSCQSTWCTEVVVGPVTNCINYFTFNNIGLSVSFNGHLLNAPGAMFVWNFGDNSTGYGENIVHTYNAPGIYYVTLTTSSDPGPGCYYTSSQSITVGDSAVWSQLYGQVFAGNFPVGQGIVLLFSMDTSDFFVPFVDVANIDSSGVYYFPMVPQGNYYIYAIPFTDGYLPTYYGDVLNWSDATLVNLGTPANPYNIHLFETDSYIPGPGSIDGQIVQGDISQSLVNKITMLLKDEAGTTIQYSQVDNLGDFSFPQLAYGTYYLYAELAGCNSQSIKVVLSASSPASQIVLALNGNSIMGRPESDPGNEIGVIYPNPVKELARINVTNPGFSSLIIEIYNVSGQMVYKQLESNIVDQSVISLPLSGLSTGIYTLKLYNDEGLMITRKLVKKN